MRILIAALAISLAGCGGGSGSSPAPIQDDLTPKFSIDQRLYGAATSGRVWKCLSGSDEFAFSINPESMEMTLWSSEFGANLIQRDYILESIFDSSHLAEDRPAVYHRQFVPTTLASNGRLAEGGKFKAYPALWLTDRWDMEMVGEFEITDYQYYGCYEFEHTVVTINGRFLSDAVLAE